MTTSPGPRVLPRLCPLATLAGSLVLAGCYSIPAGRHAVDKIEILGSSVIASRDIEARIATAPSPRFFGIWQGVVFEYSYYDKFVLQRDIARIERFYKARGFYDAKASAARVLHTAEGHVRVEIVVEEGEPYLLDPVTFAGLEDVAFDLQKAAAQAIKLTAGTRFDEDSYEQAKASVLAVLNNKGYAWAEIHGHVTVNLLTRKVTVELHATPGPSFKIREVKFVGLDKIPEQPVRRAAKLRPGHAFSTEDLESAQQALLELGVFSDVDIAWTPSKAEAKGLPPKNEKGEPVVDVVVRVTPSLLRTLRLGGGGEMDVIRTDLHATVGWEDRDFFGGLRRFSINVKPGVVLFPTVLPTLKAPTRLLPEERARAELRQPGFLEARTNWLLRGEFNIYPVLLRPINEDVILGYREGRASTGLERSFFMGHLYTSFMANVQNNWPFTYHGPLDATLSPVALRYLELETDLNFRDSAVRHHKGVWIGNNLQFADFGGDIIDVKEQPDLRIYVPISQKVTFAVRGSVGFLFPQNYGKSLAPGQNPDPEALTRDVQLLYFRAFFSGGPNSNRGYPFRAIGPHGPAPFFSPNTSAGQVLSEECNIFSPTYNEAVCAVPLGGLSLWESSAELRFPILGDLSGAVFADASDVSRQRTTLRFNYLHLSVGGGMRYATPVGPVRFDIGYRVPGMQKIGGQLDPKVDGDPGTIFGAPIAISIGVGEVF
jgi:outer membrane protein assembly factor BamA